MAYQIKLNNLSKKDMHSVTSGSHSATNQGSALSSQTNKLIIKFLYFTEKNVGQQELFYLLNLNSYLPHGRS